MTAYIFAVSSGVFDIMNQNIEPVIIQIKTERLFKLNDFVAGVLQTCTPGPRPFASQPVLAAVTSGRYSPTIRLTFGPLSWKVSGWARCRGPGTHGAGSHCVTGGVCCQWTGQRGGVVMSCFGARTSEIGRRPARWYSSGGVRWSGARREVDRSPVCGSV